jgi:hypothetical protein
MAEHFPVALSKLNNDELGAALVELGRSLDTPAPSHLAMAVRARLETEGPPSSWMDLLRAPVGGPSRRATRLAFVLAIVALALAAAVVGAGLLGLPGLRFFFEPGAAPSAIPASPSASPGPTIIPGSRLGLGDEVSLAGIDERVGFHVLVPDDPVLGPPDAAWFDPDLGAGHVTLVWAADDDLAPVIEGSDIGLIVTQFRGSLDQGYFAKLINAGTVFRSVEIDDLTGYWIEDGPHFFFYVGPDGRPVDETRRLVGDVLSFERDGLTIRIETAAGLERALDVAASLEQ